MSTATITTIILAVIGSSGLWTLIKYFFERKTFKLSDIVKRIEDDEKTMAAVKDGMLGVLYDRAKFLGEKYIKNGVISTDEYDDWLKYYYNPYHNAGGDGTIDRIKNELDKLSLSTKGD